MIAGGVGRSATNVFNFFVMMMTNRSIGAGAQVVKYDNVIETEKGSNNLLWFICSGLVCMGILIGFVLGVLFDQYFLRYARLDPDRRQERRPDDDQDLRQERPERGPDDDQDLRQERPERGPDDDQDRHQKRPERGPDDYDTRSTYGSDRHDTTPEDHPGPTTTTPRTSIPVAATTIPPIPMISTCGAAGVDDEMGRVLARSPGVPSDRRQAKDLLPDVPVLPRLPKRRWDHIKCAFSS